jgi:hypothetical protein
MEFEFRRPVYTGETVFCVWTNESVEERDDGYEIAAEVVCKNEEDDVVLTADVEGVVSKDARNRSVELRRPRHDAEGRCVCGSEHRRGCYTGGTQMRTHARKDSRHRRCGTGSG